jgi:hypothetical protein
MTAFCSILFDKRVIKGWLSREAECTERKCNGTEDEGEGLSYGVKGREARTSEGLTIVVIHFEQQTKGRECCYGIRTEQSGGRGLLPGILGKFSRV